MAQYLTPGQYVEEIIGEPPVEGASTAVAGFVGVTKKGRFGPVLVTSWRQFVDEFGGHIENSYLAYAVKGFFDNGGTQAYISRVVHYTSGSKTSSAATGNVVSGEDVVATIDASSDGTWGDDISVQTTNWDPINKTFDVTVKLGTETVETYAGLTLDTIEDIVNNQSKYIVVTVIDDNANVTDQTVTLTSGSDGLSGLTATDYIGDDATRNGVHAFSNVPVNLIAIPGVTDNDVYLGLSAFLTNRRAVAIVEVPIGKTPQTAQIAKTTANVSDDRVVFYWPWIVVSDPIGVGNNPRKTIPPSGHIIGMIARCDQARGVFKAPAGETDGQLRGVIGLEYVMDDTEQGLLNPHGINGIRSFPNAGIVVFGARTSRNGYINVRRTVDYIEDSILAGTRWTTFESNDETLWGKIKANIEAFLRGLWKAGGLKGSSEDQAFFVKCDAETTTEEDIAQGRVYCEIGVATQKPAEFIIFRVQVR